MDKKGYIKTLEAVVAIVGILVFIYAIIPDRSIQESKVPPVVKSSQEFIINEISTNEKIRDCVINNPLCENSDIIKNAIKNNIPTGFDHAFKICENTNCLTNTPFDRSVYLTDVFIVSTLENQNPKIVRIWIWRKD